MMHTWKKNETRCCILRYLTWFLSPFYAFKREHNNSFDADLYWQPRPLDVKFIEPDLPYTLLHPVPSCEEWERGFLQGDSVFRAPGFGWLNFFRILLGQMRVWQNWLGSWERWWNIRAKVNPTQVRDHQSHSVLDALEWKLWTVSKRRWFMGTTRFHARRRTYFDFGECMHAPKPTKYAMHGGSGGKFLSRTILSSIHRLATRWKRFPLSTPSTLVVEYLVGLS